jgi:uncharacterized coiled-coil protein SlyX
MLGADNVLGVARVPPVQWDARPLWVETRVASQLGLKDGQVIPAVVSLQDGRVRLWLRDFSFGIPNGWNLKDGDKPFLRVSQSPGGWGLLIQSTPPDGVATGNALVPVADPWRSRGPSPLQTDAVAPSVTSLDVLLAQPAGFAKALTWLQPGLLSVLTSSPEVAKVLMQWDALSLNMASLRSEALKRAVQSQARSMENRLSKGEAADADQKSLLRELLDLLSNKSDDTVSDKTLKELRQTVEEMDRSQAQAAQAQLRGELSLHLVLPFIDADPVSMHIHQDRPSDDEPTPPFSVDIHSRSRLLGELWLHTQVSQQQVIDLTMWAQREDVVQQARIRGHLLHDELASAGLNLRTFQVVHAVRPGHQPSPSVNDRGYVVDAHA